MGQAADGYPEEVSRAAAAFAADPALGQAIVRLAERQEALYGEAWIDGRAMTTAGRWAVAGLLVWMDARARRGDPPPTRAALLRLGGRRGLIRKRSLGGALDAMMAARLAEEAPTAGGRERPLRPTERLTRRMRRLLAARLDALSVLRPLPRSPEALASEEDALLVHLDILAGPFVAAGATPYHAAPAIRPLMERLQGFSLLIELLRLDALGLPPVVRAAAFARRFAVSRAHAANLIAVADAAGLLRRDGGACALSPAARDAGRRWVAQELAVVHAVARRLSEPG